MHADRGEDVHGSDFDSTTEKPSWKNSQNTNQKSSTSNLNDPIFDNNLVTNVTVQLGETAFLRCRVKNLGERPHARTQVLCFELLGSTASYTL
ncbi:hypothetical protein RUM44_010782 [Polyplax serrata]|uniref:Ig-like domain-containing protein n=1 Tax=Polyplax serrata TaxID=468196 RepID=A0ABR1ANA6_POLSC